MEGTTVVYLEQASQKAGAQQVSPVYVATVSKQRTRSRDLVASGPSRRGLWLAGAQSQVMFKLQTSGSVAMTHTSPLQVH